MQPKHCSICVSALFNEVKVVCKKEFWDDSPKTLFLKRVEYDIILQTARIYSRATGKSTMLAVGSRDSPQVLPVCSINSGGPTLSGRWLPMWKIGMDQFIY